MTVKRGGLMEDTISRKKAIESVSRMMHDCFGSGDEEMDAIAVTLDELPSAQPTLYGYSIDHLALIAHVMEKEGVSPEEAVRFFKDTQRICQMLVDEIQKQVEGMFESCVT
jgi:hypothetical protein